MDVDAVEAVEALSFQSRNCWIATFFGGEGLHNICMYWHLWALNHPRTLMFLLQFFFFTPHVQLVVHYFLLLVCYDAIPWPSFWPGRNHPKPSAGKMKNQKRWMSMLRHELFFSTANRKTACVLHGGIMLSFMTNLTTGTNMEVAIGSSHRVTGFQNCPIGLFGIDLKWRKPLEQSTRLSSGGVPVLQITISFDL